MIRVRKWPAVAIAAGLCLVAATAIAATTNSSGTGLSSIEVVTQTVASSTSSTTYVNVPGASAAITVDEGDYIRGRFSAESLCGGEDSEPEQCSARLIVVGPGAMNPKSGLDFIFDSHEDCCTDNTPEAHSMEQISGQLAAGTYTVRVQYAVSDPNIAFTVDDWTLSLEEVDAPIPS